MSSINCIIIEDEPLAMERTKGYVLRLPYLNLLATFDNGIDALAWLKTSDVQLIFLDINMDGFSGIQLLESANIRSEVIITTAYDQYAIKGYDLKVTDYLLKPFSFERFIQAVERVVLPQTNNPGGKTVFIRTAHRLEKIALSDILYIEGMRDYRRIHTQQRKIMTLQTFGELQELLPPEIICRVHKSFMVSLDKIEAIDREGIRIQNAVIPVSETYRKEFFRKINHPMR